MMNRNYSMSTAKIATEQRMLGQSKDELPTIKYQENSLLQA